MKYIIANINPFDYEQKFFLMEDEKVLTAKNLETPRMVDEVVKFAYMSNVFTVKLGGPKLYLNKFMKDILTKEYSYYTENKITVELI